jgi:hypothetical protein
VQEYIETLPTGGGSHYPLTSGGSQGGLSHALARKIDAEGGPYAAMLKAIAGSPKTSAAGGTTRTEQMSPSAAPEASVVRAALDSGSGTNTLFVVIVAVALVLVSVLAGVRWQSRRRARLP